MPGLLTGVWGEVGLDLALEELRREGAETEPDADKDQAGECSQAGGC